MKLWDNGQIKESTNDSSSLNYALHYSSPCVWEGMRSYVQGSGESKIFGLRSHISRLLDSAKIMGFEIPFTVDELCKASEQVVEANGGGDLYLRPIAYSENDAESAKPRASSISVKIYAFPIKSLHSGKKGVKMGISSFTRGYPQYLMQAKTSSNYHFLQSCKHELEAAGYDDVFVTDNNGHITEATVANVWVLKSGIAMTPPNDGSILPGITRRTLANILHEPGFAGYYQVAEKVITRADLYTADCVILCGTYAEVVNVSEIDGRKISEDHPFYLKLKERYQEVVRGK